MPAARGPHPDPYELLGVRAEASGAEIARAYRRLARVVHPDSRPRDPAAADQFRALTRAYELLSDRARRAARDPRRPGDVPRAWPRPAASAGQAMPLVWPLDQIPAGPPAAPSPTAPPRGGVWAGPVIIEPLPGQEPDGLADISRGFRGRQKGWPW